MGNNFCNTCGDTPKTTSYPKDIGNIIEKLYTKHKQGMSKAIKSNYPNGSSFLGTYDAENRRVGFGHLKKKNMEYIG